MKIEVRKFTPKTVRSYRNNLNLFVRYLTNLYLKGDYAYIRRLMAPRLDTLGAYREEAYQIMEQTSMPAAPIVNRYDGNI